MFVFGETPAQAARMGYDIAQQNRQAFTRANELEADYAFRANQMENAAAQNMAALARAQQQEQNQLAREAFVFGEQAKRQARADAMAKLEFDTERKDVERQFAFEEKQLKRKDELAADQADNSGASLAYNLSTLLPIQKAAKKRADDAAAEIKRVIDQGTNLGFRYDEAGKRLIDAGGGRGNVDSFNRALTMARLELNDAKSKIPDIDREVNAARTQALNSGFSITPEGLRHIKRGKVFPFQFEASTAPATGSPMTFPPQRPSAAAPSASRAGFIPLSPSQASRLRGERERDSWEAVATEAQALGQDFPSGF